MATAAERPGVTGSVGAAGLTIRTLLLVCRISSWLALSSISADRPPWLGAPTTMVFARMVVAYSAMRRPALP